MSNHLTTGQRTLLEAELRLRLRQLDEQIEQHQGGASRAEHAHDLLAQDTDDAPRHALDREVELVLSDRGLQDRDVVSHALRRVHEPDYGVCSDCAAPIPFDRLKAEPQALRCVPCETQYERTL